MKEFRELAMVARHGERRRANPCRGGRQLVRGFSGREQNGARSFREGFARHQRRIGGPVARIDECNRRSGPTNRRGGAFVGFGKRRREAGEFNRRTE